VADRMSLADRRRAGRAVRDRVPLADHQALLDAIASGRVTVESAV